LSWRSGLRLDPSLTACKTRWPARKPLDDGRAREGKKNCRHRTLRDIGLDRSEIDSIAWVGFDRIRGR